MYSCSGALINSKLYLSVFKIRLFFIEMNYVIAHVSLVYKHFTLCWNENILLGMFPYFMNISILFNQYCYNIVPRVTGNFCLWFYHVKPRFRVSASITSSNSGKEYCDFRSSRPTLLKKRLWGRCFPVNFVKFLRTFFLQEHLWWLLLCFTLLGIYDKYEPCSKQFSYFLRLLFAFTKAIVFIEIEVILN